MMKFVSIFAAVFALALPASAFSPSDDASGSATFGFCSISMSVNSSTETAFVEIGGFNFYYPNGTFFSGGALITGDPKITDTNLANECFFDPTQEVNFNVTGVDPVAGTFASETRTGFTIEVVNDMSAVGGPAVGSYAYYSDGFNIFTPPAPANVAPTADAGPDQPNVASGAVVTLDGTGSSDSDGTIASYAWTRTGGTGAAVTFQETSLSLYVN